MALHFPHPIIFEHGYLFELFEKKDMVGLQEALRCVSVFYYRCEPFIYFSLPSHVPKDVQSRSPINTHAPAGVNVPLIFSPVDEPHEPVYEADSEDQLELDSSTVDPVMSPGFAPSPAPNSSADPSSFTRPQPPLPMARGFSTTTPHSAQTQHVIERPTSLNQPSTSRALLARNSFSNLQYPTNYHPPLFSANQSHDAGAYSGTPWAENVELENQALNTTTAAPPLMSPFNHRTQPSLSGEPSQSCPERDADSFHDKVVPAQIPNYVLAKSKKMANGREVTAGQRHRSGQFWKLIFSYDSSSHGSRLEHVCANPWSPSCNLSTSQLGDMKRHQKASSHLPPESRTFICPVCGKKLHGNRLDSIKRHQRTKGCKAKQVELSASQAPQLEVDAPSTSQVGAKRSWADMTGEDVGDEYPAKVSRNETIDGPSIYFHLM